MTQGEKKIKDGVKADHHKIECSKSVWKSVWPMSSKKTHKHSWGRVHMACTHVSVDVLSAKCFYEVSESTSAVRLWLLISFSLKNEVSNTGRAVRCVAMHLIAIIFIVIHINVESKIEMETMDKKKKLGGSEFVYCGSYSHFFGLVRICKLFDAAQRSQVAHHGLHSGFMLQERAETQVIRDCREFLNADMLQSKDLQEKEISLGVFSVQPVP